MSQIWSSFINTIEEIRDRLCILEAISKRSGEREDEEEDELYQEGREGITKRNGTQASSDLATRREREGGERESKDVEGVKRHRDGPTMGGR